MMTGHSWKIYWNEYAKEAYLYGSEVYFHAKDGEGRYRISLDASAEPEGGLLLRIIFYDRYDAEAGSRIIRDGEGEFQCPLKTFSYEVQLIHAGAAQFHFHWITLTEVTDEE